VIEKDMDPKKDDQNQGSPQWGWTTKLVVGLVLVTISLWLLYQFQSFVGPLITAFILAYFIRPVAKFLQEKIKLPWRLSVTLIYLILVLSMLGLLTWGGVTLVEQIQTLIRFIQKNIDQLPDLVSEITTQTYEIGPFTISPIGFNWDDITNEIVRAIQPVLGRLGNFAGSMAAGAASIVSWLILIIFVSYFLLAESEGIPSRILNINIPGYAEDMRRISAEVKRIWNGFIRGEILVVFFSFVIYTVMLGAMQIQFFIGLAAIAAIGQLIPYLGAWVTWISFGLVALFQTNIPFNLPPGIYMVIVLGISMIANSLIDNVIRTKVMADNLKVHPALVLIGALVGVQLIGFIGIVIAAPIVASLKLMLNYIIAKLSDRNPWGNIDLREPIEKPRWLQIVEIKWSQFRQWITNQWEKAKQGISSSAPDSKDSKSNPPNSKDES
jgi:predicted PurR-regulated permease PerM